MLKEINSLGKYKNIDLKIDFGYLSSSFGSRKSLNNLEKSIGWGLIILTVLVLCVATLYEAFFNYKFIIEDLHIVDDVAKLLVYVVVGVLCYGIYLVRDREVFDDRLGVKDLDKLRADIDSGHIPQQIDITLYFDTDLVDALDSAFTVQEKEKRTYELLMRLVNLSSVRMAAARLGLSEKDLVILPGKLTAEEYAQIDLVELLKSSFELALENSFVKVDELAVFTYLCKTSLRRELLRIEVNDNEVNAMLLWAQNLSKRSRYLEIIKRKSILKPTSTVNRAYTSVFSTNLVKYSRDFTAEVVQGNFELSYAREKELQQLVDMITSGESSASLVLGQPGVGKTTFVKNLAVKMVVEDVPKVIQDMRLVGFDFNRAYALAKNEQEFKATVENILQEVAKAKNIILVIDDLDELVNVKKELSSEVINLITDAMDVHKIRIVATSSVEGYARHIKPFKSLDALFNKMTMEIPSEEIALQILFDFVPTLEKTYKIKIGFEAADRAVELSNKFAFERVLPDKAIDLIEEAISKALAEGKTVVDADVVDRLVAGKVGVNLGSIGTKESEFLTNLEAELHKRIIGQHQAVEAVASALRRSRAGLTNKSRPIASFLFFGPTGVGKTELAKTVSELYFGGEDKMIRIDMSEYQEDRNLGRLIGVQSGEEFEGGYLTEAVRSKPYALVLLDEIEKANPKVLDLFLQILDEGKVKDGLGRDVVFTNTIIIATSNVASREVADLISRGVRYSQVVETIMPLLRKYLRIEFLNRFDKLIMFKPLLRMEVEEIAKLMLRGLGNRLEEKGIEFEFGEGLLKDLANLGFNPIYGAREMRRVITDTVEDKIANMLITGQVKSGDTVVVNNLNDISVR
jgi:ATP-dependent Clp protease ATP-binding subunit ClpC